MGRSRRAEQLIAGLGLIGVALCAWLLRARAPDAAPPQACVAPAGAAPSTDSEAPARAEGASPVVAVAGAGARRVTVSGRCIDTVRKDPLAGCQVTVAAGRERIREPHERPASTALSDREGRFATDVPLHEHDRIHVHVSTPGHAPVTGTLPAPPATVTAIALGDIVLVPGVCLHALVVDEDDRPVPGIAVQLQRVDAGAEGPFGPATTATAESDARGAFAIASLAGGVWTVLPRHAERIRPAGDLVLAAGQAEQNVTIVVRPPDPSTTITGSVVGADGRPVVGVQVAAEGGPAATARTDERGVFQLVRTDAAADAVQLRVRGAAGHDDLLTPWMPWGSRGVALALQRASGMVVTVVEAGTAQAVEDFGVSWCHIEYAAAGQQGAQGAVVERRPSTGCRAAASGSWSRRRPLRWRPATRSRSCTEAAGPRSASSCDGAASCRCAWHSPMDDRSRARRWS
jgi:hypothetical protein